MVARLTNEDEIARMREAGRLAASVLEMIGDHVEPGVSTEHLNELCHRMIVDELGCIPAPLNYTNGPDTPPFPRSICTSGNHVVELRRTGTGPLYYNGYLSLFTLEDYIPRAGLELRVERKYYRLVPVESKVPVPGKYSPFA